LIFCFLTKHQLNYNITSRIVSANNQASWFETWFDTPLYEKLYANRDMKEAEYLAELVFKHFPPALFPNVIDIACGRGRHSFNLAKLGYDVTGVDLSERAIQKANTLKQTFEFAGCIQFKEHDMRLKFEQDFDLAVNLFTSFGYLPDDEGNSSIFANISHSVKNNGALVVDFLNPGFVSASLKKKETRKSGEFTVLIERFIKDNAVHKQMRFIHSKTGEEQAFSERVKLYKLNWFEAEARKNGLSIIHTYGSYKGGEYLENSSPRMIMLFRKSE